MPTSPASRVRGIATGVLIAVVALPVAYVVLTIVQVGVHYIWKVAPSQLPTAGVWAMCLLIPTAAGALVAFIRSRGNDGHNPMAGIATNPVLWADYPSVIAAILVTLLCGLVLGPEVALVATGSVIGTEISRHLGGIKQHTGMMVGIATALLALIVGPVLSGGGGLNYNYHFEVFDLVGAVGVAAVTAGLVALGRLLAYGLIKVRGGDRPRALPMAAAGLVVGVVAALYFQFTGNPVILVLTSGEEQVRQLLQLGAVGAILITVLAKWLAYAISLGSGFRGGPYFPAIFVGAGVGAAASLVMPTTSGAAAGAGMIAAITYLAHGKWVPTLILGALLGAILGGWEIVPVAAVAALAGRALPEIKVKTTPTGQVTESVAH